MPRPPDDTAATNGLLFGNFDQRATARAEWRDRLAKRATHRALNIPEDEDVNIDARKTTNGIGTLGAIGIALAAGLPAAFLGWNSFRAPADRPAIESRPVATAPACTQRDSDFFIEDYDLDTGKVEHRTRYRSRSGVVERLTPEGAWVPAPTVKPPQ